MDCGNRNFLLGFRQNLEGGTVEYRAVGNRLAVDFASLKLSVTAEQILELLLAQGFGVIEVDIVKLARQCIGAQYRRGARLREAPGVFDCSSLIKWLYSQRGIWLPRRSIQQRGAGWAVSRDKLVAGDVIFTSGFIDYYFNDPADGVGHVGIATENRTVIHAANKRCGVVETDLAKFAPQEKFRGVRRYIPRGRKVPTLTLPPGREVEISNDLKWIFLQNARKS